MLTKQNCQDCAHVKVCMLQLEYSALMKALDNSCYDVPTIDGVKTRRYHDTQFTISVTCPNFMHPQPTWR